MSVINNCIYTTCDRCGYSNYYTSQLNAENVGWLINCRISDEQRTDLCPKCSNKWDKLVQNFLYGEIDDA